MTEKLPKFADIIGLYADDEDGRDKAKGKTSGVVELLCKSRVHVRDASNSPVYTEQQIEDFCEKVENLHLSSRAEGRMLFEAVQIIRQLQGGA